MTGTKTSDPTLTDAIRQRSGRPLPDELQSPGPVIPKATIRLHTKIAHQLFFGRSGDAAHAFRDQSFSMFANNLNALWTCSKNDDPYADAKLIQIEEQINLVRTRVTELLKSLDNLLGSLEDAGIRVDAHESIRPVDIPISFRAVHAAVTAQLLGLVDRAIQKALMGRNFGLVTAQDWQRILDQSVAPMRHLFKLARFRASGATRDDFAANNARAAAAEEKLGQLPADILAGLRRPQLGPRQHASTSLLYGESSQSNAAGTSTADDSIVTQSLRAIGPGTAQSKEAAPTPTRSVAVSTRKRSVGNAHE